MFLIFTLQSFLLSATSSTWSSLVRDLIKRDQTFAAYGWSTFFAISGWAVGGGLAFLLYTTIDDTGVLIMDAAVLGGTTFCTLIVTEQKKFSPPTGVCRFLKNKIYARLITTGLIIGFEVIHCFIHLVTHTVNTELLSLFLNNPHVQQLPFSLLSHLSYKFTQKHICFFYLFSFNGSAIWCCLSKQKASFLSSFQGFSTRWFMRLIASF